MFAYDRPCTRLARRRSASLKKSSDPISESPSGRYLRSPSRVRPRRTSASRSQRTRLEARMARWYEREILFWVGEVWLWAVTVCMVVFLGGGCARDERSHLEHPP